jgi:ACR3 family arsenite efflux pump ArsB
LLPCALTPLATEKRIDKINPRLTFLPVFRCFVQQGINQPSTPNKTEDKISTTMGLNIDFIEVAGSALLFVLVFGMSATVDIGCMRAQIKNKRAIATALFLQFILLPFLGFVVVKALNMDSAMGITLLVVTSSREAPTPIGGAACSTLTSPSPSL